MPLLSMLAGFAFAFAFAVALASVPTANGSCSSNWTVRSIHQLTMFIESSYTVGMSRCLVPNGDGAGVNVILTSARLPVPTAKLTVSDSSAVRLHLTGSNLGSSIYHQVAVYGWVYLHLKTASIGGASAYLQSDPISPDRCVAGWDGVVPGACYGSLSYNGEASFTEAATACRLMRVNLAHGFSSSDVSKFLTRPHQPPTYRTDYRRLWVGVMEWNGRLYFIDGSPFYHSSPSSVPQSTSHCTASGGCGCIYYHRDSLYRADCSTRLGQLCSGPPDGADTFYSPDSIGAYVANWSGPTKMSTLNGGERAALTGGAVVSISISVAIVFRLRGGLIIGA